jgi:glutamate synthase domain-containing protein 2
MVQKPHTIMRNFPIVGRGRYIMEVLRPKIYQYFIESDTDGTPISRIVRSVVYQRAKEQLSTTPFGTQLNVYEPGYEWINHSLRPKDIDSIDPTSLRVNVGSDKCSKPYSLSLFNVSAMSFGALSKNAIEALNRGANLGGFAHNTGEGAISPYHQKGGGDLIWQIGTGYFGCRTPEGNFSPTSFRERAELDQVKMIEIKISQGAKPGHGGILPASKNTPEIALTRQVAAGIEVQSPSYHKAFHDDDSLLDFIEQLRELSGGKPIGIKLCMGNPWEFEALIAHMQKRNTYPDFITIDGGEGGTGAAPLEFSNSIGMSLVDGVVICSDFLVKYGLREKVRILAAGKVLTGFDIVKIIALGADACYSARGMMLALGCIQALECNNNHCPTGVATQDPSLYVGLDPVDKGKRVFHYHQHTLESVAEIIAATGLESSEELHRHHIWRRITPTEIRSYAEIFPEVKEVGAAS